MTLILEGYFLSSEQKRSFVNYGFYVRAFSRMQEDLAARNNRPTSEEPVDVPRRERITREGPTGTNLAVQD